MIFLAVIIGLVLIALIILCIQLNNEGESYSLGIFCGWAMTSLVILEMICICESVSEPRLTPMDVYRGKTTLEYTIRDGEVIDSVVVWKEKIQ
jgi:hypothetical protein